MRATEFEFHHRFWFICLVYVLGFGAYKFDHMNVVEALALWIFKGSDPHLHSLAAAYAIRCLFALSATLVTAGAWIRTWGGAYLRTDVVHDTALHTERLVADGPYRHLRNPLYLGSMFFAMGMAMMTSRTGAVILIAGNLLIVLRLIGREETDLERAQGESYRAFLAAVPRLCPSLRPCLPAGGMQPKWLQSILGEAWLWAFAVDGFLFAWKLNGRLYGIVTWVSGALYLLTRVILGRSRPQNSPPTAPDPPPLPSA